MQDTYTMDGAAVIRDIAERVGSLTDDEVALVRTLTPADLAETARAEHLKDLVVLLTTVRDDEAMAEYVYAIAPAWDGSIETLLLGGRVTTAFSRFTLESSGAELSATASRRSAPARRSRTRRVLHPSADANGGLTRHLANGVLRSGDAGGGRRDAFSPGVRCERARARAHPLRRGWEGRVHRTTGVSVRSRSPARARR